MPNSHHSIRPSASVLLLLATVTVLGLQTRPCTAAEDNPRGKYRDAKTKLRFTLPPIGEKDTVTFRGGVVRVKSRSIIMDFENTDVQMALRVDLRERVEDTDRQIVEAEEGELIVRDQQSGAVIAWGGEVNAARYKITRRGETEWRIKHKKKLKLTELSGSLWSISKMTLRGDKTE